MFTTRFDQQKTKMAKSTKYFVLIIALVVGGTRYMNLNMRRVSVNNDVGIWDTEAKDGQR